MKVSRAWRGIKRRTHNRSKTDPNSRSYNPLLKEHMKIGYAVRVRWWVQRLLWDWFCWIRTITSLRSARLESSCKTTPWVPCTRLPIDLLKGLGASQAFPIDPSCVECPRAVGRRDRTKEGCSQVRARFLFFMHALKRRLDYTSNLTCTDFRQIISFAFLRLNPHCPDVKI